jgi:general stress protein 26
MKKEEAVGQGLSLANRSTIAMLGTYGNGYPDIRAMIKNENDGLKTMWFTTNTSSKKMGQLRRNSKVCVYFVDFDKRMGLRLIGTIDILQDPASKQRLWREGFERYYPLGISDPDYSVLRFTAQRGSYYHKLANVTFDL